MSGAHPIFQTPMSGPAPPALLLDSDEEESFVVLGRSLENDAEYKSADVESQDDAKWLKQGTSIIEEGKKVAEKEETLIDRLKELNVSATDKKSTEKNSMNTSRESNRFGDLIGFSIFSNSEVSRSPKGSVTSNGSVPPKESVPPKQASIGAHHVPIDDHMDKQEQRDGFSFDGEIVEDFSTLSSEDLQKRIMEIIEENKMLRSTLEQNNNQMREQYNRTVEWHAEVRKIHDIHKEKILEAKQHIDKLTIERNQATSQLSLVQEQLNVAKRNLQEVQTERTEANTKIDASNMEIKKLQCQIEVLEQHSSNLDEAGALQTQLTIERNQAISQLSLVQEQLNVANRNLEEVQTERTEANAKIDASNKEIKKLQCQIELLEQHSRNLDEAGALHTQLIQENTDTKAQLFAVQEELNEVKVRLANTQISQSAAYSKISSLNSEVQKLQQVNEQLKNKQRNADTVDAAHIALRNEVLVTQEELHDAKTKLAEMQIVQTEVYQSRSAAYARISSLSAEITRLQQTIEQLQNQRRHNDEIYALQTQLDQFKTDFEEERRLKEIFREEKEKITEDLQNLQRRNQQLQERIEMICDNNYVMYQQRGAREGTSRNQPITEGPLKCPKCFNGFQDVHTLEKHCYNCIE